MAGHLTQACLPHFMRSSLSLSGLGTGLIDMKLVQRTSHTQWDDIASPLAWKALSVGG